MSALQQWQSQYGLDLSFMNRILWKWVRENPDLVIYRRKFLGLFTVTLRVRDVHPLIRELVGEAPATGVVSA